MRDYEGMFVIGSELREDAESGLMDSIKDAINKNDGAVERADKLGKKKLAYPIKKRSDGIYYLLRFKAQPHAITKLKGIFKMNESILRCMLLNLEG